MEETGERENTVAVVGGGLAGLVAATVAARGGKEVTLLERASLVGGRATSHTLADATVNQGPRALYLGGAAAEVLAEIGVAYSGQPPKLKGARAFDSGRLLPLPLGPMALATTPLLGWRGRLEAVKILALLDREIATAPAGETLDAWLAHAVHDEGLRRFLRALVRLSTYANAPHAIAARAALTQVKLAQEGVLYVDGGWSTLVRGAANAAKSAGVNIRTSAPVSALRSHARGWELRFGDASVVARDVVLAVGPGLASELTGARFDVETVHAACLDLCLGAIPAAMPRFVFGIDRALYYSVHSDGARLSARDTSVVHVSKYIDPNAPIDAARDETELEGLVDLAYPGWRADVRARRFLPRMVVTHGTVTPRGRPAVGATGLPGVHLAGDWVGEKGMLADAACASARDAARALLRGLPARAKVDARPRAIAHDDSFR